MDERAARTAPPSDYGLTAIVDQNLTDRLQVFARYAYSDATLTNVRQLAKEGWGCKVLGRDDDLTGAAFFRCDTSQ